MNNNLDPSNLEIEKLIHNICLSMIQFEKMAHINRVKERMDAHLASGRRMFGTPPSWYQMKNGMMQPFMPNAKIVQKTYRAMINGKLAKSPAAILAFMEGLGFTDRNGNLMSPTRHHVRTLLNERSIMEAAGFVRFRDKWIKGKHTAIITEQDAMNLLGKTKVIKPNYEAVIYCRTATKNSVGILNQEQLCREYCENNGYQIASIFRDEAISGAWVRFLPAALLS